MIERRNFYRILHVQPDASMAVIQENYRLLRQKLKIHPNLSGVDWNENLLEAAYQTLSNSSKRSAYDAELLRYYHIDTLTHGAFSSNTNESGRKQTNSNSSSFGLKRNTIQPILSLWTRLIVFFQITKHDNNMMFIWLDT